ncbi:methylated-DNA--[protein]-cysteine S-methyltransferase [Kytococcus aerolatus]|nr:methylated-DNA--[protein]-cysteine S-methyltransferase [Kytococcus aerolatus]
MQQPPRTHRVLRTPVGELTLVGRGEVLQGVYWPEHSPPPDRSAFGEPDEGSLTAAAAQLTGWFAGERTEFDLELELTGTAFQQEVWAALRRIPHGEVRTYGQIAEELGRPRAVRAVGAANGCNRFSIVIPCHRVVSSAGRLHGYAGGVEVKRWLLAHEGVDLPR